MKRAANKNPGELLIFGNPKGKRARRKNAGNASHKPDCKCFACKHARGDKTPRVTHNKKKATARRGARLKASPRRSGRNPQLAGETKQAVRLFKSFSGRDAKEILEKQQSAAMRMDYAALGDLVALGIGECPLKGARLVTGWEKCPHIGFQRDGVKLASSPEGRQLYLIGGSQDISSQLDSWDAIDTSKDFIDLGDCTFVVYDARKVHDGFRPTQWVHQFGEDTGALPRLMFDTLKKTLFLIGGEYFIDTKGGVSPGIEN